MFNVHTTLCNRLTVIVFVPPDPKFKCARVGCHQSFRTQVDLDRHSKVHASVANPDKLDNRTNGGSDLTCSVVIKQCSPETFHIQVDTSAKNLINDLPNTVDIVSKVIKNIVAEVQATRTEKRKQSVPPLIAIEEKNNHQLNYILNIPIVESKTDKPSLSSNSTSVNLLSEPGSSQSSCCSKPNPAPALDLEESMSQGTPAGGRHASYTTTDCFTNNESRPGYSSSKLNKPNDKDRGEKIIL